MANAGVSASRWMSQISCEGQVQPDGRASATIVKALVSERRTSEGSEWRPAGRVAAIASAAAAASVGPAHDPDAGWSLEKSSSGSQSCQDSVSKAGGSRKSAGLLKTLVWGLCPSLGHSENPTR
jgi:hypothetical protein